MDFYPSISRILQLKAVNFARAHTEVNDENIYIIMHAKRTLLFSTGCAWTKCTDLEGSFDVAMGAFDCADICHLVDLSILDKRRQKRKKEKKVVPIHL